MNLMDPEFITLFQKKDKTDDENNQVSDMIKNKAI